MVDKDKEKDISGNIVEEESISEEPKKSVKKRTYTKKQYEKYTVLNIIGDTFVLIDEQKNGIRVPIPEKFKNTSVGDIIEIEDIIEM